MQRLYEMGVPVQYESSPYSERFTHTDMAATSARQIPGEFTPGGRLDMDSLPNPAFAQENVSDLFSGLSGYEDVQAELEQAYATPSIQSTIASDIQKGLTAYNTLTGKAPQVVSPASIPQTQPWMWIVLGLLAGGAIYLMIPKKGGT